MRRMPAALLFVVWLACSDDPTEPLAGVVVDAQHDEYVAPAVVRITLLNEAQQSVATICRPDVGGVLVQRREGGAWVDAFRDGPPLCSGSNGPIQLPPDFPFYLDVDVPAPGTYRFGVEVRRYIDTPEDAMIRWSGSVEVTG